MDESLSSLGDQICQHFVQSRFDERSPSFLPDGCIKGLISEGAISNELFDEDDDPQTAEKALIRFVKDKAKKVFAITVCSGITGSELLKTVDNLPAHVAIKEILVNNNLRHEIEKNYEDERKAFSEITDLRHSHIIQRIAAITRGEKRYFMFQWADGGNLREFRKEQNRPTLMPDLLKQTTTQLCGLADALHALHNYKDKGNYRHGDLKPETFSDSETAPVLASSRLQTWALRSTTMMLRRGARKQLVQSMEAPEVVTNSLDKARSRLYDIWSMGCIMLECVIWLMYGYEALDNLDDSLNDGYDSSFFKTKNVDGARVV
ncbi:kinase-like domain-containing protein [Colletotrichum acutatum]|uniref:Kinase-like domain-containing protein n=1 Tax=Glomerella acutata TaxID=27357 RepID=A0AAD8UE04_GLOAC|nr:kinase-like domain-containing protein [Colletotrichum acutatum]KAK1714552.1 kinase-like domain-containing protein [Colletotrichum acutatum]